MEQNRQTEELLRAVIEEKINPALSAHMGGAVLGSLEDGTAYIKFTGSCKGCYAAEDTLENIVKPAFFEAAPELKDVKLDTSVDEELLDFARALLRKERTQG